MTQNGMRSLSEAIDLIRQGKTLLLAGDEALLDKLPPGKWIAGTAASFMTADGGIVVKDRIFVTDISDFTEKSAIKRYRADQLPHIASDYSEAGFTVLIVPADSEVLTSFSRGVQSYNGVFNSSLLG